VPAHDGKKPIFLGGGGMVDARIRTKMLELLSYPSQHSELDEAGQEALRELRQKFTGFALTDTTVKKGNLVLFTFTGTRINRSLFFLLNCLDGPVPHT
jgi:ATP-dependent Lhr-like helicase